jgi:hypothetical protein
VNPGFTAAIALGALLVVAWDGFCLYDLARANPATVRYLPRWAWAIICLISCPWGGLLYVIVGRDAFGRSL